MSQVDIAIDLGDNVGSAEAAARELAEKLYPLLPINDSRGQSAKNEFIEAWFRKSERSERAAKNHFGTSDVKPVINDQYNPIEADFAVDGSILDEATGVTVTKEDDGTLVIVVPPQDC